MHCRDALARHHTDSITTTLNLMLMQTERNQEVTFVSQWQPGWSFLYSALTPQNLLRTLSNKLTVADLKQTPRP